MRAMGFSTGALALGNFGKALKWLYDTDIKAVELSALRKHELEPLVKAVHKIDSSRFAFVSVHAPSKYEKHEEREIVNLLVRFTSRGWPVVVHPDSVYSWTLWRKLGQLLFIENMDNRKPIARCADELEQIFNRVPDAKLCFDIGHARQLDLSMKNAVAILERYRSRLGQIHISEVSSCSRHNRISSQAMRDFQKLAPKIPAHVPVILETPVGKNKIQHELKVAKSSLTSPNHRKIFQKTYCSIISHFLSLL